MSLIKPRQNEILDYIGHGGGQLGVPKSVSTASDAVDQELKKYFNSGGHKKSEQTASQQLKDKRGVDAHSGIAFIGSLVEKFGPKVIEILKKSDDPGMQEVAAGLEGVNSLNDLKNGAVDMFYGTGKEAGEKIHQALDQLGGAAGEALYNVGKKAFGENGAATKLGHAATDAGKVIGQSFSDIWSSVKPSKKRKPTDYKPTGYQRPKPPATESAPEPTTPAASPPTAEEQPHSPPSAQPNYQPPKPPTQSAPKPHGPSSTAVHTPPPKPRPSSAANHQPPKPTGSQSAPRPNGRPTASSYGNSHSNQGGYHGGGGDPHEAGEEKKDDPPAANQGNGNADDQHDGWGDGDMELDGDGGDPDNGGNASEVDDEAEDADDEVDAEEADAEAGAGEEEAQAGGSQKTNTAARQQGSLVPPNADQGRGGGPSFSDHVPTPAADPPFVSKTRRLARTTKYRRLN
jgi:hypothetical protein